MDWFHCNQCFKKSGSKFAVSSCGHICCEGCIKSQCCICGASCSYLPITDGMKTPEKVFFMDPVKLLQSTIAKISQVAVFQQKQMERVIYHFKNKSSELERRLREFSDQGHQLSELKKENAELKKQLLELRRISPGHFQTNAQRVSLPVAVTSP
uniref:Si:ch211-10e2.1 n=1 Tax=Cyprinodon variegatus TaxID=28743 RepID=A0A3Q2CHY5_CYPVA